MNEKLGESAQGATFVSNKIKIRDMYNGQYYDIQDDELAIQLESKERTNEYKMSLNKDLSTIYDGKEGIVHNGFYDMAMLQCSVNIPNTRRVQNDNYNCNITWSLGKVPTVTEEVTE